MRIPNTDRIKDKIWYFKLVMVLGILRLSLKVFPPDKETLIELLEAVDQLKEKLEAS